MKSLVSILILPLLSNLANAQPATPQTNFSNADPPKNNPPPLIKAGLETNENPFAWEKDMTTWDLNIDAGLGSILGEQFSAMARIRAGVQVIRYPLYFTLGPTLEVASGLSPALGLQGEIMQRNYGTWFQVGGMVDTQKNPAWMASAGISFIGVEVQSRFEENQGTDLAVYGKIRIPLSMIFRVLK